MTSSSPPASSANLLPGISVVIPVYRSAGILPELIAQLLPVLTGTGEAHEVLLVDDGNTDGCWDVIASLSQEHAAVRGLRLMRNFGQHNALLAGIRAVNFDRIVTMDDDLQHPPEHIPTLLAALNDEVDVVYGCPETQTHGLWRDLASVITKLTLQKAMGSRTAGMASAYRVFRTRLRDAFANYNNPFVSIDVLLTWGTTRFTALKIAHQPRHSGESNYTFAKLLTHAANMLTGFTDLPLKLASLLGFALTFFGLGVLVYVVGGYLLNGTTVAGFPFIASVIAIFSGAQLFALGIIGEYLARIHFRTMDKPSYAVGDTTDDSA